jgi:Type I restriction modification DNA specificity domain
MGDGWRRVPLGAVARLDIDPVRVRPGDSYRIAGVLNAGQGVFGRGTIDGTETNYHSLHRLHEGQLVMRKLTAWEGPITTVPPEFDGFFVSPEFPTYTFGSDLDPHFMRLICQRPEFWEAMRLRSTGTVQRRKRVSPSQLLSVEIDLPPLVEQRRIADLFRSLDATVASIRECESRSLTARDAIRQAVFAPHVAASEKSLGDVATWYSGGTPKAGEPTYYGGSIPWAVISDMNDGVLTQTASSISEAGLAAIGGRRAVVGAVLVSMYGSIGRVAMAGVPVATNQAIAWGVFDETRVLAGYGFHWLRHQQAQISALGRGATQRNINRAIIRAFPIPVPPLSEQRIAVALLDSLDAYVVSLRVTRDRQSAVRSQLSSQVLSGGQLIPGSYDRFLDTAS